MADWSPCLKDDHLVNLRANSPQQGEDDAGPSKEPYQDPLDSLGSPNLSSKVNERFLALIDLLSVPPGLSSVHKLGFVYLLEGDPDGIISCMLLPNQA